MRGEWSNVSREARLFTERGKWILGFLRSRAIKHILISLYMQTKSFYKIARIAIILNDGQWIIYATGIRIEYNSGRNQMDSDLFIDETEIALLVAS